MTPGLVSLECRGYAYVEAHYGEQCDVVAEVLGSIEPGHGMSHGLHYTFYIGYINIMLLHATLPSQPHLLLTTGKSNRTLRPW